MDLKRAFVDMGGLSAKKAKVDAGPSAVLFFWNLPVMTSEADLTQLCVNFGTPVCVLKLKEKNQAFVEMGSVQSASDMLEYYKNMGSKPIVRGEPVDVQFSSRTHISKKEESSTPTMPSMLPAGMMMSHGAFQLGPSLTPMPATGGFSPLPGQNQQPGQVQIVNPATGLPTGLGQGMPEIPGRILHVNISSPTHAVSPDILFYVFSQYGGTITKIVCFEKNNVQQALVEFADANSALVAKTVLQNHSVFTDGCVLRIDQSRLTSVNVRAGDPNARDYTSGMAFMGSPGLASSSLLSGAQPGKRPSSIPAEGAGKVILVGNLSPEKVTPLALFKLFGTVGDVLRVKIMFNKRDNALIQFRNEIQAAQALQLLQGVSLYGVKLHVTMSRMATVALPPPGSAEMYEGLTQDYDDSPLHRFNRPGSRNEQNIAAPSETLHVANILETVEEQTLVQLFGSFGVVVGFKFLPNTRKMAVVKYSATDSAVNALIALHGAPEATEGVSGERGLQISFSKAGSQGL